MQFLKVEDVRPGAVALAKRLETELAKSERVLWLIGGGSSIAAVVEVMHDLPDELTQKLAIFMTDERYGEVGHIHSNARQLQDAGFQAKDAIWVPMLEPGFSMEETQERYSQALERAIDHADKVIGQFGIGPDGHIAGILPGSPAVKATGWITGYEAANYTRVTMTFDALRHIDAAYVFAFGKPKLEALTRLRDETIDLENQPSQILKELAEAYIYNDQIGD